MDFWAEVVKFTPMKLSEYFRSKTANVNMMVVMQLFALLFFHLYPMNTFSAE